MTCWEVLQCGKEKACPAYPEYGSCCWSVTGTLCCGDNRAAYEEKIGYCRQGCKFYNGVMLGSIKLVQSKAS